MTPLERSRKALEGVNIRKVLEESNLPVEIVTAIADRCEYVEEQSDLIADLQAKADVWAWCVKDPYGALLLFCEATNADTYGAPDMKAVSELRMRQFIRERVIELMEPASPTCEVENKDGA